MSALHVADRRRAGHIGIVACSSEGAALCYRTICAEGAELLGPHAHPEISLHGHSLAAYVACLDRHDLPGVGELMLSSAEKLARSGADFLICPDNTIHQALRFIDDRLPLPWLNIAETVADHASERGFRRLGVLGTRWLVESPVYPDALGAREMTCVLAEPGARAEIDRIIMDELVYGVARGESIAYVRMVIDDLRRDGCDAVVLGCTELPLVASDVTSPLPALDSTRLLARAALRRAVQTGYM